MSAIFKRLVNLANQVLGTLPVANGGTGAVTLASNGALYGAGTGAIAALAVNSTATNKFLTQSSSAAPAWAALVTGDIPTTITAATTFSNGIVFGNGGTNVNFYQEATQSATFTFNGTGSPGSATVTLRIVRIGSMVSVLIPDGTTATTGTSSNTFSATAALPTWARPTVDFIGFSVPVQQNAIVGTTMGILRVRTSGNMDLFRDTVATVWSNANANSGFISSSTTVGINGTYLNYHIY